MKTVIRTSDCAAKRANRTAALLALAAFLFCAAQAAAQSQTFEHYKPILEKFPTWMPPPPPPTTIVDTTGDDIDIDIQLGIPPTLEHVKLTLISRFNGMPAAGFTDGQSGKPYFLVVGQSFDDFELLSVNMGKNMGQENEDRGSIRLKRGIDEADIPMYVNPATTNRADVTSFGQPPAAPAAPIRPGAPPIRPTAPGVSRQPAASIPPVRPPVGTSDRRGEEIRQRRDEMRKQREAEQAAAQAEFAALTPEEKKQRLHDTNVDIILNNSGPPLPIELTQGDMKKLHDGGMHVPGFSEAEDAAAAAAAAQPAKAK